MKVFVKRALRAIAASLLIAISSGQFDSDVAGCRVSSSHAAEPTRGSSASSPAAQIDDEIARIRAKLFERVDYPLLMRRLDSEIELAKAEIQMHQKVLSELERLHRLAHESKPFLVTIEELKIKRLSAELRLDDLEAERCLLQKYQRDERRLRELEARRDVTRTQR